MCKFVFIVCFGWLSTIPPPEVVNFLDHIRECCWQLNIRVKIGEIFFHKECFCFMVLQI